MSDRSDRFVAMVTGRAAPAVAALAPFDAAGLAPAEPEVAAGLLLGGRGWAYAAPEDDMVIYQTAETPFCGVICDGVRRAPTVRGLRDWARGPAGYRETAPRDPEIALAFEGPHPLGGATEVLVGFEERAEDVAAHASVAWVREDA